MKRKATRLSLCLLEMSLMVGDVLGVQTIPDGGVEGLPDLAISVISH